MNKTNYEKLEKSLERLREQYEFLKSNEQNLEGNLKEAVQESVIQRFEICYDTLWKQLKKHLEDQGLVKELNSPKSIFRRAYETGLLENLQDWIDDNESYNRARIDTSHDYSMEKAENTLGKIGDFIEDTTEIYQAMIEQQ